MPYAQIAFETAADGIAVLTVNRPQKLNALNVETLLELEDAFTRVDSDASIQALIVTGAGEKAFVAGADINQLAAVSAVEAERFSLRGQRIFRKLELMRKPSVAAINGFALGGGLELAMACTLRLASPNAKLGQPEVKLGIVPGYGGTQRLPRLVGRGLALEILLSGDPIDAADAYRIGLVNRIVPQDQLIGAARELLSAKILRNGPVAVGLTMQAVDAGLNGSLEEGLRFEAAAFGLSAATEDRLEGTSAFLAKRPAAFTGR